LIAYATFGIIYGLLADIEFVLKSSNSKCYWNSTSLWQSNKI